MRDTPRCIYEAIYQRFGFARCNRAPFTGDPERAVGQGRSGRSWASAPSGETGIGECGLAGLMMQQIETPGYWPTGQAFFLLQALAVPPFPLHAPSIPPPLPPARGSGGSRNVHHPISVLRMLILHWCICAERAPQQQSLTGRGKECPPAGPRNGAALRMSQGAGPQ
jgi:hypothetical protein